MRGTAALLILALTVAARFAAAVTFPAERTLRSVEWYAADSDLVVRGKVRAVSPITHDYPDDFALITLDVIEAIKGPAKSGEAIRFVMRNGPAMVYSSRPEAEHLICLVGSERHGARRPAVERPSWTKAPWAMRDFSEVAPIRLNGPALSVVLTIADRVRALEGEEIVKAFRERARQASGDMIGEAQLLLKAQSGVFMPVPSMYVGGVWAPVNRNTHDAALRWAKSKDEIDRYNALAVLKHFKSEQSVAAVREMLGDPFSTADQFWPMTYGRFRVPLPQDKWSQTPYPLRRAAWTQLREWGIHDRSAVLGVPAYPARAMHAGYVGAAVIALVVLLAVVWMRGWRTVAPGSRPRIFAGFGGVCLILLLAVIGAWVRSAYAIDEIAFRNGEYARAEITLLPGGVRILSFPAWKDPFPPTFTSAKRTDKSLADWRYINPATAPPERGGRLGFWKDDGAADGIDAARPYVARTIPYWFLIAALAVPLLWRVWRVVRYRVLLPGHCRNCGYDMRATPQRCPECGWETAHVTAPAAELR